MGIKLLYPMRKVRIAIYGLSWKASHCKSTKLCAKNSSALGRAAQQDQAQITWIWCGLIRFALTGHARTSNQAHTHTPHTRHDAQFRLCQARSYLSSPRSLPAFRQVGFSRTTFRGKRAVPQQVFTHNGGCRHVRTQKA